MAYNIDFSKFLMGVAQEKFCQKFKEIECGGLNEVIRNITVIFRNTEVNLKEIFKYKDILMCRYIENIFFCVLNGSVLSHVARVLYT